MAVYMLFAFKLGLHKKKWRCDEFSAGLTQFTFQFPNFQFCVDISLLVNNKWILIKVGKIV